MMAMDGEPLSQVAEWRLNSGGVFMRASDDEGGKQKSTRLNSSHLRSSRMPSSA